MLDDETVVQSSEVGRELVLLAKVRAAAKARITMRLSDRPDGGCRVEMTEVAVSRPLRWLPDSLQLLGVAPRNRNAPGGWRRSRRSRTPMPSSSGVVDAVVIGAGHNGLVAAAMLADAGWGVAVLEAQSERGGAVRSAELFPGYISDLYSATAGLRMFDPRWGSSATEIDRPEAASRHAGRPVG